MHTHAQQQHHYLTTLLFLFNVGEWAKINQFRVRSVATSTLLFSKNIWPSSHFDNTRIHDVMPQLWSAIPTHGPRFCAQCQVQFFLYRENLVTEMEVRV